MNMKIVELGDRLRKPVVATTDSHYPDKESAIYRNIVMSMVGFNDTNSNSLYLRTTAEMLKEAEARGKSIKLLCRGWMEDGIPHGKVGPEEVDRKSLMAVIDGTSSVVSIQTDLMGKLSVLEHNPEIEQTAFGIFTDLIAIAKRQENR